MSQAPREARDWDLRSPVFALQVGAVALALFCLLLSQANDVVYWGFGEHKPATSLSAALMALCMLIALSGARRSDLPRPIRNVGGILAVVAAVALLDEILKGHEWIGKQVQRETSSLSPGLTWYTDDVIVLIGAIVGAFIVYRCIRYVARAYDSPRESRELLPYLACAAAFAVTHGLFDIASHSHFMIDRLWPDLTMAEANEFVERIGYFEEACKLWTEWFAVLLLLKLFHRQHGALVWSLLVAVGWGMAVLGGLWGVDAAADGIPCLTTGDPMKFLRNFHSLYALGWIWTGWLAVAWVCFRTTPERIEASGLLFAIPLSLVLGRLIDPGGLGHAVGSIANGLMGNAFYGASVARHGLLFATLLLPGLIAGLVAGQLIRRWPIPTGVALALATLVFSPWRSPTAATIAMVALLGGFAVVSMILDGRLRTAVLAGTVLAVSTVAPSAWWSIGALTWTVFTWAGEAPADRSGRRAPLLLALALVQLALCAALVFGRGDAQFIPNYEWEPNRRPVFEVMYQPLTDPAAEQD